MDNKVNLIILYYIIRRKSSPVNQNKAGKWPIYVIFTDFYRGKQNLIASDGDNTTNERRMALIL